ncbi:MAG TPA: NAD-dependent succinate-semialdehyde dehydrogenase [Longimicrobiales bacterium]|nr:NAD-dependent succinate-semialdehyde dehydrogenase [Longimicrobiales bacterium]
MYPESSSAMPFAAVNPATGEEVRSFPSLAPEQALDAASRAGEAHLEWRTVPLDQRARMLRHAAGILREEAPRWARLMAEEMGKPVAQGESEAEKCAWVLEYYADHGADFLADRPAEGVEGARAYWSYQPLGVVLAIMPWNFPFWQVFRAAAPTLMAGNAVLLKHAPGVPGCARACAEILHRAGIPEKLFQNLFLEVEDVETLLDHPAVRAATLTGSVGAGKSVAALAGARVKKCVLELGGSDPYVVLSDADLELALERSLTSRLINTGQSCISAKRLIVVDEHHEAFLERVVERFSSVKAANPFSRDAEMGPMARTELRDGLHQQVWHSVEAGARLHVGGQVPAGPGAWYPATVLSDVGPGMPAYHEELFGPVAVVIRARDDEDAVRIANDTDFGLGAAVFTRDVVRGEALARDHMEAGAVFVNDFVRSDPRLPFGGIKESGMGRELSPLGILEFVNVKTVWVAT